MTKNTLSITILATVIALTAISPAPAQTYAFIWNSEIGHSINNLGQVVGFSSK